MIPIKKIWRNSFVYKKLNSFVESRIEFFVKDNAPNGLLIDEKKIQEKVSDSIFFSFSEQGIQKIQKVIENDVYINLYTDSLLSLLIYKGTFELNELAFLKKILNKGDTFIDVGANIGLFSLIASKYVGDTGKVIAFEPTPLTFTRLNENITSNKIKNIFTYPIALSNTSGNIDFNVSTGEYDAWNSIVKLHELKNSDTINIHSTTLDQFISLNNIDITKISLIKIDVEGWELPVLQGAEKLLKLEQPPVFIVEFTDNNASAAGFSCSEIYDYLVGFKYRWYEYDRAHKKLIPSQKQGKYPYNNLIAMKHNTF